jgi:DNA-binding beta-propeller fold protein YncE
MPAGGGFRLGTRFLSRANRGDCGATASAGRTMPGMRPALAKAGTAAVCAIAVAIICTGCTSASSRPSAQAGTGTVSASAGGTVLPTEPPLPARSLPAPACATATAPSAVLTGVRTATVSVPGSPFGVAAAPEGRWAFVVVPGGVEVLRAGRSLAPAVVRTIAVAGNPAGLAVTPDGRYLLAADGSGAVVISVARAEQGTAGAVLGTLSAPGRGAQDGGAIEVAVSPDGQFAFVTLEYADRAVVFNLGEALRTGFGAADYAGSVALGQAAVGMAVSPDGQWLYATSETVQSPHGPAGGQHGTLTVIGLRRAETDPASSVVATVDAGCEPVRVITSADGGEVWVTARGSDGLLCFSAAGLVSDPARALVAVVRVGEAPVGLAAVRGGSLVVVADSNRFGASGATADLDVVNVAAALSRGRAVVGHIPSGLFPREMALLPDGTLLVSNYASSQVEAVDVASIPGG